MGNNHRITTSLIEQFLSGKLSDTQEKELLDWIDSTPNSFAIFQNEQERLRPIIAKRQEEETSAQWRNLFNKIQAGSTAGKKQYKRIFIPAAAAVLLIALVIGSVFKNTKLPFQTTDRTVVATKCGEKTSLLLADGTRVILNSGSKIIYPGEFQDDLREVELYGEAFFEVSPDKKKPFIVKTYALRVRVLGTAFNLEAFPDADEINTTLVHGKVRLEKESNQKIITLAEMTPYDYAVFKTDKQEINIEKKSNIDPYIAWKDGKLVFMNASIEEVAKKLELWYNVHVRVDGEELKKTHFTGTFTNESIDQALNLLKISYPIEYSITKFDNQNNENDPIYDIVLSSGK